MRKKYISNKILYYFMKEEKKGIVGVAIISLVAAIFSTINIAILIPIVNFSLGDGQNLEFINIISTKFKNIDPFIMLIIFFLIISILSFFMEIGSKIYSQKLTNKIILNNEMNIFEKLTNMDYLFYSQNKQGEITYTTTIAPQSLAWIIQSAIDILQSGIIIILYVILLLSLSLVGTFTLLVIGLVYVICISKKLNKIVSESSNSRAKLKQNKNVMMNEFLTGIKTVKMNNAEEYWKNKYSNVLIEELKNYYKMIIFQRIPECLINFLGFFIIGVLALILYIHHNGNITEFIGTFSAFGMTLYRLLPMLKRINGSKLTIHQYFPDIEKIYELININIEIVKSEGDELEDIRKGIRFNNLTFRYDKSEQDILKNINVEINKNEITALVGQSGAGKSTLVNLIMRLYKSPDNTILIDDIDINRYSTQSIIDKIAYVSQDVFLINDTIENNIKFGLNNVNKEEIIKAAKIADAHEFISKLEDGYQTQVGDLGNKLSGGQKQRIAIARAILRNKDIIILDEATSALDNISERNIQNSLNKLSERATLIIIAHRLSTIENANKIIVMSDGQISEVGSHNQLMMKQGIYHDLYVNQKSKKEIHNDVKQ